MRRNLLFYWGLISVMFISCNSEKYVDVDGNYMKQIFFVQNGTVNGILTKNITNINEYNDSLAVYCSGVSDIKEPVFIQFCIDNAKFDELNLSEKAAGKNEYETIPIGTIEIGSQAVIDKGNVIGFIPIKIKPSNLMPGVNYMFVLTIKSVSDYSVNKKMESIYCCLKLNDKILMNNIESRIKQF